MMDKTLISRRRALQMVALSGVSTAFLPSKFLHASGASGASPAMVRGVRNHYPFELPALRYAYSALEPMIDAKTMEIHHGRHHQGYTNNLNSALEAHPTLHEASIEELLTGAVDLPESVRTSIINNGGGYYNHSLFWDMISPGGPDRPIGRLAAAIEEHFGSIKSFEGGFKEAALTVFGSGWAWLVADGPGGDIDIVTTANQESPISRGLTPVLGIDVWEHAYYLNYQNRRADYVSAFLKIVNWTVCERNYVGG